MKVLSKHSRFNFVSARIVLILITCVCWSFTVRADTISVAAGWARPPYINPLDHTGFELDIIRQVLSRMGHKTKVVYVPHQTTIELLNDAQVDIALTLNEGIGVSSERLSDVYINYQNVVLSLSKRNLKIAEIQDLSAFRLVGFQSAKDVLGDEYSNLVKGNSLYFEMADQKKQVELLLQGVVDAIVIDLNVFDYLSTEIAGKSQFEQVDVHPFFAINSYRAGFKNQHMKKSFDLHLKQYLKSNQYKNLKAQYQIRLVTPVLP